MSRSPDGPRPGPPHPAPVEITRRVPRDGAEGVIEQVRRHGDNVEVDLLLCDGSDATARLDVGEWDWLELRAGDIVAVRPLDTALTPCLNA
jgi:hypothetical protein